MTTATEIIGAITGLLGLILGVGVIIAWIEDIRGKKATEREILTKIEEGSLGIWKSDLRCWNRFPSLRCWIILNDVKIPNKIKVDAAPDSIKYATDDQSCRIGWIGMLSLMNDPRNLVTENMEPPNSIPADGRGFEVKIAWKDFLTILIFTGITEMKDGKWHRSDDGKEEAKITGKLGSLSLSKQTEGPVIARFKAANSTPPEAETNLEENISQVPEPPIRTSEIRDRVFGIYRYSDGKICLAEIGPGTISDIKHVQLIRDQTEWLGTKLFKRSNDLGVPEQNIQCISIAESPRSGLGENWIRWEEDMTVEGSNNWYQYDHEIKVDKDCLLAIADAWYRFKATGYGVVARGRVVNDIIQRISRPYADLVLLWCGQSEAMMGTIRRHLVKEIIKSDRILNASRRFGYLVNVMHEMMDEQKRNAAVYVLKTLLTKPLQRRVMCDVLREFITSKDRTFGMEEGSNTLQFGTNESIDGLPGSGYFVEEEDLLTYLSVSEVKRVWLMTTNNSSALQHLPKANYLVR
jgi:hypothetical protein